MSNMTFEDRKEDRYSNKTKKSKDEFGREKKGTNYFDDDDAPPPYSFPRNNNVMTNIFLGGIIDKPKIVIPKQYYKVITERGIVEILVKIYLNSDSNVLIYFCIIIFQNMPINIQKQNLMM